MRNLIIMKNVVNTEFLKLRKSKILWCIPISILIPAIITISKYVLNGKCIDDWNDYFLNNIIFLNMLVIIGFLGILAGFIYSREYIEHTISNMFTYPISRVQFFIGKLIVMLIFIAITLISEFILLVGIGLILKHAPLSMSVLIYHARVYMLMILMHFSLVTIVAFLSIYKKSMVPVVAFLVIVLFTNILIFNSELSMFFPWSIPALLSPHEDITVYINTPLCILNLSIIFVLGLVLSIKSIKSDVY